MASVYPGALDNIDSNKTNPTVSFNDHPDHHNLMADAINALQAEMGLDPAGSETDVADRLTAIETALSSAGAMTGETKEFTGAAIPGLGSVWLLEDGVSYPVASFPALAAFYGATGVADGLWDIHPQFGPPPGGEFRVPDSLDRVIFNAGTAVPLGLTDAIPAAGRGGPLHGHSISSASPNTGNAASAGEGASHHTGHILNPGGAAKLIANVPTFSATDVDPSHGAGGVAFTKLTHTHPTAAHDHSGSTSSDPVNFIGYIRVVKT